MCADAAMADEKGRRGERESRARTMRVESIVVGNGSFAMGGL